MVENETEESDLDIVERLLDPIYKGLTERGVPDERLPTIVQVISHLLDFADETRLNAWMQSYAAAEGEVS
jgi:hypothetical protein